MTDLAVIVGIDPGRKCGFAMLIRGELVATRVVDGSDTHEILGVVQRIDKIRTDEGPALLCVEDQFLPRDPKKLNPKSISTLYRRRHVWEVLCELYEVPTRVVHPSTWQGPMLKSTAAKHPNGDRRANKARSIEAASRLWPHIEFTDDNLAEACLIAQHELYRQAAGTQAELLR